MLTTKKLIFRTLKILFVFYVGICSVLYLFQEKLIFFPTKLSGNYQFPFTQPFEEIFVETEDKERLHGLLFTVQKPRGLIFYLHGNAGALDSWGSISDIFTKLGYDMFLLDYRGYGKSSGTIRNQSQLFNDVQTVYDSLKHRYRESTMVVIGYSIGTGPATYLACRNQPKLLILQAPYFSLADLMKRHYPIIPTFLLKYKFQTNEYLRKCKSSAIIFHGDQDEVIDYNSSLRLTQLFKQGDTLITLKNQGHSGINENLQFQHALKEILPVK